MQYDDFITSPIAQEDEENRDIDIDNDEPEEESIPFEQAEGSQNGEKPGRGRRKAQP